jgi:hypothetical protein
LQSFPDFPGPHGLSRALTEGFLGIYMPWGILGEEKPKNAKRDARERPRESENVLVADIFGLSRALRGFFLWIYMPWGIPNEEKPKYIKTDAGEPGRARVGPKKSENVLAAHVPGLSREDPGSPGSPRGFPFFEFTRLTRANDGDGLFLLGRLGEELRLVSSSKCQYTP